MRLLIARIVLSIGIALQLLLISALPLSSMDADAWRSLTLLVALLLVSAGSAIALGRWSYEAVTALIIGSIYAAILIAWTATVSFRELATAPAASKLAQFVSIMLALGAFATVPAALAVAWPLRRHPG